MVRIRVNARGVECGQVHGNWEVIGPPFSLTKSVTFHVVCRCSCGTIAAVDCGSLAAGKSMNCQRCKAVKTGARFRKHGGTDGAGSGGQKQRLYRIWSSMKTRCCNPSAYSYASYGGRGVAVCGEWSSSFTAFRDWALSSGYADDLTIDRIDNGGDYEPDNCRWVTRATQNQNTRQNVWITAFGETKTRIEWMKDPRCRVCLGTYRARIARGWDVEWAISAPLNSREASWSAR